jgi:hypothetical protein
MGKVQNSFLKIHFFPERTDVKTRLKEYMTSGTNLRNFLVGRKLPLNDRYKSRTVSQIEDKVKKKCKL